MARAEAHLVGYMLAIYIDAAHSYGVAGEGQCSGKALGRPYSMEQTFHQIWYGHAHGAFACLASSLVIPSSAIVLKARSPLLAHALGCFISILDSSNFSSFTF